METENDEIVVINKLIATEEELQQLLLKRLNASYKRKKELMNSRLKVSGKDVENYSDLSIPDLLEIIFRKYGKQHITVAATLLETEFGRSANTQTISGALIRYANRKKRFKKVGKNIFDLIDAKEEVYGNNSKDIN